MKEKRAKSIDINGLDRTLFQGVNNDAFVQIKIQPFDQGFQISIIGSDLNETEYDANIHYHFDKKTKECHVHTLKAFPEGKGLGVLLIYLAALHASEQGYREIRTLNSAPNAINFYKIVGFENDPHDTPIEMKWSEEGESKVNTITSTIELVADTKKIVSHNEKKLKWSNSLIPSASSMCFGDVVTTHHTAFKKYVKSLASDSSDSKNLSIVISKMDALLCLLGDEIKQNKALLNFPQLQDEFYKHYIDRCIEDALHMLDPQKNETVILKTILNEMRNNYLREEKHRLPLSKMIEYIKSIFSSRLQNELTEYVGSRSNEFESLRYKIGLFEKNKTFSKSEKIAVASRILETEKNKHEKIYLNERERVAAFDGRLGIILKKYNNFGCLQEGNTNTDNFLKFVNEGKVIKEADRRLISLHMDEKGKLANTLYWLNRNNALTTENIKLMIEYAGEQYPLNLPPSHAQLA